MDEKEYLKICKLLDDIDCCVGYSISDGDMPKFWEAQERARQILKEIEETKKS